MQGGNSLVKLLSALASLIRRNRPVLRCNHVIFYFYNILDDACLYFISAVLLSNYYHNITQGTTVIHLYFDVVFLLVLYVNNLVVFCFFMITEQAWKWTCPTFQRNPFFHLTQYHWSELAVMVVPKRKA